MTREKKPRAPSNAYVLSADCRAVTYTKISLISLVDGCSFNFSSADRSIDSYIAVRSSTKRHALLPGASRKLPATGGLSGRPAGPASDRIPIRTHGGAGGLIGGRTGEPPVDVHEQ